MRSEKRAGCGMRARTQAACRGKYLHNQPFSVARHEYGTTQKPAGVRA